MNDPPVIQYLNGDNAAAVANGNTYALDEGSNATVSDIDSNNFDGGTLVVTLTNPQAGDATGVQAVAPITRTSTAVSYFNGASTVQIATYTGVGTASQTYTFNANATPAAVQALVRALAFATNSTVAGTRNITYALSDGDGGMSTVTAASTVTVTLPNVAPVNAVPGPVAGTEDAASIAVAGISVADGDAGDQLYVTLSTTRAS